MERDRTRVRMGPVWRVGEMMEGAGAANWGWGPPLDAAEESEGITPPTAAAWAFSPPARNLDFRMLRMELSPSSPPS